MTEFYDGPLGGDAARQHHLLRHSLPTEERGVGVVLQHFDTDSVAEAFKLIKKMSQRDLQAKFKAIYGAKTFSNNNNWLRRKLFEAIGVDPAKGAGKKPAGGAQKRRKAPGIKAPRAAPVAKAPKHVPQELDHSAAEALLVLGDVAAMMAMSEEYEEYEGEEEEAMAGEESLPSASTGTAGTSSGVAAPSYGAAPGAGQGGADREVPDGHGEEAEGVVEAEPTAADRKASPFGAARAAAQLAVAHSPRSGAEEEGETEPAPISLFQPAGHVSSRANSSNLAPLDATDLSHMATNVGQLYAWLLARQQAAPAGLAPSHGYQHPHPLLPPPVLPIGLAGAGGYGYGMPAPLPGAYAMMNGVMAGHLPVAPPLFGATARTN